MTEWYNSLEMWQQWCLVGIIILCTLGILRLVYLLYHILWYDKRIICQFINDADFFAKKFRNNKNNSREAEFILRKSREVSQILGEDIYDMPVLDYASSIKYGNIISAVTLEDLVRRIYANYLKWDESNKSKKRVLLLQLLLPFAFWPFRGIETILLVFSELLRAMGINIVKSSSKVFLYISVIGGIVGFIGSIASILSLFGVVLGNSGR